MENLDQENNKNVSLSLIAEYGASDSDSDDQGIRANDSTGNDDSDPAELSEMVLKNNIINACAHGPLSRSNVLDELETTRQMIIDSSESGVVEYEVTEYRDVESDSDSSSSNSSSDVDSVKDVEEISSGDENEGKTTKVEVPKVPGELDLDDLPPIEDLAISLPAEQTTKIGTIASIVDKLVVVRALPETPAVDIDSVLFLENGAKTLGKVFDVFGPVTEPHYCVRFNGSQHVRERGVVPGMDVYIAPRTEHTHYVFLTELIKMKGSDASWLHDVEPPPTAVEYSDDEEERRANKARKEQRQNQHQNKPEESDGETSKQPTRQPRKNQRPSESSSRFGTGPSRGRNPFSATRRNPMPFPRFGRPWVEMRTPPPHSEIPPGFSAPPNFPPQPMFPPFPNNFGNSFQWGYNTRIPGPMNMPPFRQNMPTWSNYSNMAGPPPWGNGPQPPPGT